MGAQGAERAPDACWEVREDFLEEEVCRQEPPGEGGPGQGPGVRAEVEA